MIDIWSQDEEAKRLQERFDALKAGGGSQAKFARDTGMPGGASMITQHLKLTRPMALSHAIAYATGFNCTLAEISPRHAANASKGVSIGAGVQLIEKAPLSNIASLTSDQALESHLRGIGGYLALLTSEGRGFAKDALVRFVDNPDAVDSTAAAIRAQVGVANEAEETSRQQKFISSTNAG